MPCWSAKTPDISSSTPIFTTPSDIFPVARLGRGPNVAAAAAPANNVLRLIVSLLLFRFFCYFKNASSDCHPSCRKGFQEVGFRCRQRRQLPATGADRADFAVDGDLDQIRGVGCDRRPDRILQLTGMGDRVGCGAEAARQHGEVRAAELAGALVVEAGRQLPPAVHRRFPSRLRRRLRCRTSSGCPASGRYGWPLLSPRVSV